jgi:hypothetical protein
MFKQRLAGWFLLLAVIFGVGVGLGLFGPRWAGFGSGAKTFTTATLLQQVKTVSELVTVQYIVEKVVVLEDVKWVPGLGENRLLMVAHGVVKAGLDLGRLEPSDFQVSGKKIVVRLPAAQITETYLDEKQTRVIERSTGFLRSFDKNLEQTARERAVGDIARDARAGGILRDAEARARAQLTHLFKQLGFEEVEFSGR